MQNNKIIDIARKGFIDSLDLLIFSTEDLLNCLRIRGKENNTLPHVLAELCIRYYFAPSLDFKKNLLDVFPDYIGEMFLEAVAKFHKEFSFLTDLDSGYSRKIKDAIIERRNYFFNADGAFPVCSSEDAFLLPFYLSEHKEDTPWVVDGHDNEIPEWSKAIEELQIPYQVKVAINSRNSLIGHSLQLPVYLASLVKQEKFLPFDPYKFISTGAIEQGKLKSVQFSKKYEVLCKKNIGAYFVCPKPLEDLNMTLDSEIGVMPEGFSLYEIRNFCGEFIVKHHLLKNQLPSDGFVGRQQELAAIHALLNPYIHSQKKKVPILLGASGVGKTALANRYARICCPYEYRKYISLDGNQKALFSVFNKYYESTICQNEFGFKIDETYKTEQEKFVALISLLERKKERILFILDNVSPDLQLDADVKNNFPNYSESCIDFIATSTMCCFNTNEIDFVQRIEIKGLNIDDGLELFRSKRKINSIEERKAAEEIIRFVDGNAWAIDVISEVLKQKLKKSDDDYQKKLVELQSFPLQALSPNSSMVRIAHDKEINPVLLIEPLLKQLDEIDLLIAQAAACCDPKYIFKEWLRDVFNYNKKLLGYIYDEEYDFTSRLIQSHILIESQELFCMHRLTQYVLLKKYEKECMRHRGILSGILKKRDIKSNVTELIAYAMFEHHSLENNHSITISPLRVDIDDFLLQNICISFHPLMNDFLTDLEKESYICSFVILFESKQKFSKEQKCYLITISRLFKYQFDISKINELTRNPTQVLSNLKTILLTEKRQKAWLADAVFCMSLVTNNAYKKIMQILCQVMKIFDWQEKEVKNFIKKYLLISKETCPEILWRTIKTLPGNYSWKSILDYRKVALRGLWDSLLQELDNEYHEFWLKRVETEFRLAKYIMDYEYAELGDFCLSIKVMNFISQCKISCWIMTSDMKNLIMEMEVFEDKCRSLWNQANEILYFFGEKQIDFPSAYSIRFEEDYSSLNQKRWFFSLKRAYEKYEKYCKEIDLRKEKLCRQIELYQHGKFAESIEKIKKEEQEIRDQERLRKEKEEEVFEFVHDGKKNKLEVNFEKINNIPFDIHHISSIIFFRNEWFLFSDGLWHSKNRQYWEKINSFPVEYCNTFYRVKLNVSNGIIFALTEKEIFYSIDGFNWSVIKIKQKISSINNIFYFDSRWWLSVNIAFKYFYKQKGVFGNKKISELGVRTVFFEAETLDGIWELSNSFALEKGQVIEPNALFISEEKIYAICSWEYRYYNNNRLAQNPKFIHADKKKHWGISNCSHELMKYDEPNNDIGGYFVQGLSNIFCATKNGLFFYEENQWKKKIDCFDFSAGDNLFAIGKLWIITISDVWYKNYFYISDGENDFRKFKPRFWYSKIFFHNNQFIACNTQDEEILFGELNIC